MKTIDDIVTGLNKMVNTHQQSPKEIESLLIQLSNDFNVKFKFIDLELYDEVWLKSIVKDKVKFLKLGKIKIGIFYRDLERKCMECIELKKKLNISTSTFIYDDGYLFYFCMGSTYIDDSIKKYFNELFLKNNCNQNEDVIFKGTNNSHFADSNNLIDKGKKPLSERIIFTLQETDLFQGELKLELNHDENLNLILSFYPFKIRIEIRTAENESEIYICNQIGIGMPRITEIFDDFDKNEYYTSNSICYKYPGKFKINSNKEFDEMMEVIIKNLRILKEYPLTLEK